MKVIQNRIGNSITDSIFQMNAWMVFFAICATYLVITYIQQEFILTDSVYYTSYGEQMTVDRIAQFLEMQDKWQWIGYAFIPIVLILQVFVITICLNIGTLILNYKVSFGELFGMVMKASLVFAFGQVLYTFALQFYPIETFDDFVDSNIFSLLAWVGTDNIPSWFIYPVSLANIFTICFFLVLAGGMAWLVGKNYKKMLAFIAATYGAGLLLWVLFIVFLQLNLQ